MSSHEVDQMINELRRVMERTRQAGFDASAEAMELVLSEMQRLPAADETAREIAMR